MLLTVITWTSEVVASFSSSVLHRPVALNPISSALYLNYVTAATCTTPTSHPQARASSPDKFRKLGSLYVHLLTYTEGVFSLRDLTETSLIVVYPQIYVTIHVRASLLAPTTSYVANVYYYPILPSNYTL